MATEKWIAGSGQGLTWSADISVSGLSTLDTVMSLVASTEIDNSAALDMFMDLEFVTGADAHVAPNFLGVYLYPLLSDATYYGEVVAGPAQRFATEVAGIPAPQYWVGNIQIPATTAVARGMLSRIIMPPAKFKIATYNGLGVNIATTSTLKYRTYNRAIA